MIESIIGHTYQDADVVVLGVPYECSTSFGKGTSEAPQQVLEMLNTQIELYDRYTGTIPSHNKKISGQMVEFAPDTNPEEMVSQLHEILLTEKRPVIMIGGEHSISIPAFQAVREKYPIEDITVVQIDAHFDLRQNDSDYSEQEPNKYAHSTVMQHAHTLGFNILPVGIRTMAAEEHEFVKQHDISYFEWGRYDIATPSIKEVIAAITTNKVYLTIDVDGFDPSVMPGTGTPFPGGLSWEYGNGLITELFRQKTVVGSDIVEISTALPTQQTVFNAAQLTHRLLAEII